MISSTADDMRGIALELAETREKLLVARAQIITLRQLLDQRDWQINHDPLTDLLSREGLVDAWQQHLLTGRPPTGLVLLDLDGFKQVNDRYGHAAGDAMLIRVAQELGRVARGRVARLGGDEFAVILAGPLVEAAISVITFTLSGLTLDCGAAIVGASVGAAYAAEPLDCRYCHGTGDSQDDDRDRGQCERCGGLGVDPYSHDTTDLDTLLARADEAMYAAKRAGGSRWAIWAPGTPRPDAVAPTRRALRDRPDPMAPCQYCTTCGAAVA